MNVRAKAYMRFLTVFIVLGGAGIAATLFTLVNERLALPFGNTYTMKVQFSAADGVVSGLGQPVNVVGVKVGQVIAVNYEDGRSLVTLELNRGQVPHVYSDAAAVLEPITPLDDLQINLTPGGPPAAPMAAGSTIGVQSTTTPVPLSDLLSSLDVDTRTYLSSMIASLDQGTAGRGSDIRRMLQTLGPTTDEVNLISRAFASRRIALARVVHNLGVVTRAAAQDHQLASVVAAGNQTLTALSDQQSSLRQAIAKLPPMLSVAHQALDDLKPFAEQLGPTVSSLLPAVRKLPATLRSLTPFAREGAKDLRTQIRPLVSDAVPVLKQVAPVLPKLVKTIPNLSGVFQALEYLVNEAAYNPNYMINGTRDQSLLYWLDWGIHNWDSVLSSGDADGGIGRATVIVDCQGAQDLAGLQKIFSTLGFCPV